MKQSTYKSAVRTVRVIQTHDPEGKPLPKPRVRTISPKTAAKSGWLAKNGMHLAPIVEEKPAALTPEVKETKPKTPANATK